MASFSRAEAAVVAEARGDADRHLRADRRRQNRQTERRHRQSETAPTGESREAAADQAALEVGRWCVCCWCRLLCVRLSPFTVYFVASL